MKSLRNNQILLIKLSIFILAIALSGCTQTGTPQISESVQNNDEINSENILNEKTEELVINDELFGYVKVILEEYGDEHIYTPLKIQWLDKDSVFIKEVVLNNNNPDVWSLSINSLENTPEGLVLELSGTHSYSFEEKDFSFKINENEVTGALNTSTGTLE
jgi:hypothetical protein